MKVNSTVRGLSFEGDQYEDWAVQPFGKFVRWF